MINEKFIYISNVKKLKVNFFTIENSGKIDN